MVHYCDVVILGGGVNGVLTGIGLTKHGIKTAIIEQKGEILNNLEHRVFSISRKSKEIFECFGVWEKNGNYCPLEDILIFDGNGSPSIRYSHKLVGNEPMGYTITGKEILSILKKNTKEINLLTSTSYSSVDVDSGFIEISLSGGKKVISRLAICAEGKNSKFRQLQSIETFVHEYHQRCITCNIKHERPHRNIAIEHFFSSGPFAILPMYGGYDSSIVWTEKCETAKMILQLPIDEFESELYKKCGEHTGCIKINGKILGFPVSMVIAKRQYAERSILVGDAFHSIHPVAGQGLNVGIRDVAIVVEVLSKYYKLGSDIGQRFISKEIENRRLLDNYLMSLATFGINSIFSNKSTAIKTVRGFGMSIIEMLPSIKKRLITHAMGMSIICNQ
ncbi:FAD-dependent monooxygenase [Anaplasma capra]|uniref:FAD-dependent monooxygenase n=1 Tax=Anaplasma capra TaxID=1562740 RepID=UPI0021D58C33|nr:FAD-dependent monooxygenase [Anaplasma capra]MCU7612314.1 FAD-dependent monooxygenase [Anaplasma capra]